jgi:hypothetical protein
MADDPFGGPDDLKTEFVFVNRGDPPPLDWMARHPGWVRFPAVMIPRDSPHHPDNRAYPPVSRVSAREGDEAENAGDSPDPASVSAPPREGRYMPMPPAPGSGNRSDAVAAYRRSNGAVASYLVANAALDECGLGHSSGGTRTQDPAKSKLRNKHPPGAGHPAKKRKPGIADTKAVIAKARVGYGETAGLYPQKDAKDPTKDDPKSAADLQEARRNIIDVAQRNAKVHRAQPQNPNNPIQKHQWNDNRDAARLSDGSLRGKFFFIRQNGVGNQRPPSYSAFRSGRTATCIIRTLYKRRRRRCPRRQ